MLHASTIMVIFYLRIAGLALSGISFAVAQQGPCSTNFVGVHEYIDELGHKSYTSTAKVEVINNNEEDYKLGESEAIVEAKAALAKHLSKSNSMNLEGAIDVICRDNDYVYATISLNSKTFNQAKKMRDLINNSYNKNP